MRGISSTKVVMKIAAYSPFFLAVILFLCSCKSRQQNNQNVNLDTTKQSHNNQDSETALNDFYFAFANEHGDTLITMVIDTLDTSRSYFSSELSGKIISLRFVHKQAESPRNTGRHTHYNLPHLPGYLFALAGNLDAEQTTIIFPQNFLAHRKPLSIARHRALSPLSSEFIKRIESDRKLTVLQSWHSATLETIGIIGIIRFENEGDTALASLALITPSQIVYEDYIGDVSGSDVWRADDGGEFFAEGINVVRAFLHNGNIELLRTWAGPEGEHTAFLRQAGQKFIAARDCYRYWVPE